MTSPCHNCGTQLPLTHLRVLTGYLAGERLICQNCFEKYPNDPPPDKAALFKQIRVALWWLSDLLEEEEYATVLQAIVTSDGQDTVDYVKARLADAKKALNILDPE